MDENFSTSNEIITQPAIDKSVNQPRIQIHSDMDLRGHLQRLHDDEIEVQRYLSMDNKDPMRKRIIDTLRKEGDFTSGKYVPVQGGRRLESCELPCTHCRGYYSRKTLRRHVNRCSLNSNKTNSTVRRRPQSEGQTLLAGYFGPRDPLRTSGILRSLQADEISLVAKKDKLICEVARRYIKSHKQKHLLAVAKRYMRRLARLLIEVRRLEGDKSLTLASLLHPSKFKIAIIALKNITQYDAENKTFNSPSFALQMGTLLKKAITAAYSMEVQRDMDSPRLNIFNAMKKLIDEEWATEISTEACQNINVNRFNKPTIIPLAEDLAKMRDYLENLLSQARSDLTSNNMDEKAYKLLIEGVYCSVLLFNKRRVGELQRIHLSTYVNHINEEISSGDFEQLLSPSERVCIKKIKRIVIPGKRGRGVPVLFDESVRECLDIAIKCRDNFFQTNNIYLFALPHTSEPVSGYHTFRKHATKALGASKKVASLTSTKLRKHLATVAQILKMGSSELEQLATFMGHSTKTHEEWYRLPADIYQTAKVSKILVMSQKGSIEQFKGKRKDELEIDDEGVIESDQSDEEEIELESSPGPSRSAVDTSYMNKKRNLKKWTTEEKTAALDFFKEHLKKHKPPRKNEVLKLMELYPNLFQNRKWDSIKVFICNE
ncbi:unnamed protein product, partial [Callosobruchus maculatus]